MALDLDFFKDIGRSALDVGRGVVDFFKSPNVQTAKDIGSAVVSVGSAIRSAGSDFKATPPTTHRFLMDKHMPKIKHQISLQEQLRQRARAIKATGIARRQQLYNEAERHIITDDPQQALNKVNRNESFRSDTSWISETSASTSMVKEVKPLPKLIAIRRSPRTVTREMEVDRLKSNGISDGQADEILKNKGCCCELSFSNLV